MDTVPKQRRSEIMARIRSKNTGPEIVVRRFLHAAGLRYRLYHRDLPGRPDIVFPSRRACVFVHGCFWHGCPHCVDGRRQVKSNMSYWTPKIAGNQARDARHYRTLIDDGWSVWIIWECQLSAPMRLDRLAEDIRTLPRRFRGETTR